MRDKIISALFLVVFIMVLIWSLQESKQVEKTNAVVTDITTRLQRLVAQQDEISTLLQSYRPGRPTAKWTDVGYYPGGKKLGGGAYVAKGMVCAANLPEIQVSRGCYLRITRWTRWDTYSIVVLVNDYGPDRNCKEHPELYYRGVDLSPDAAAAIGIVQIGHDTCFVENLGKRGLPK